MKYLKRTKDYIEVNGDLLMPKVRLYKVLRGEGDRFQLNYIILKDHTNYSKENVMVIEEDWKKLLYTILKFIDLEVYYETLIHSNNKVFKGFVLEDLLTRIEENPDMFLSSIEDTNRVKLLVRLLKESIEQNNQITQKQIKEVIEINTEELHKLKEKQVERNNYMQNTIHTLKLHKKRIETLVHQLKNNTIPLKIAESLIERPDLLNFSIDRVEIKRPDNTLYYSL